MAALLGFTVAVPVAKKSGTPKALGLIVHDVTSTLCSQVTTARGAVYVQRVVTIARSTGSGKRAGPTAEGAPSPEARAEASTRGDSGASEADLVILRAISQSRSRNKDSKQCCDNKPKKGSRKDSSKQ